MKPGWRGQIGRLGCGLSVLALMGVGCEPSVEGKGGSPACVDPATDCPATETACVVAVCERGACAERNVPLEPRTQCTDNGGGVCDGAGQCIGCIDATDCASGNCDGSQCVGTCGTPDVPTSPPSCQSGDPGAGDNCGSSNKSCCDNDLVPCGTYLRSYDAGMFIDNSNPATVSDFRLDTYEITVGRFRAFVNSGQGTQASPPQPEGGAHPRIPGSGWNGAWTANLTADAAALKAALACDPTFATWTDTPGANELLPINCVTWYEAFAFCAWDGGRLPTEAEWNYAAAGGAEHREFPWGPGISGMHAVYYCKGDGSAAGDCAFTDILPVGSKSPRGDGRWGQADLAGSVWEWTLDAYDDYMNPCNDCANLGGAGDRVIRGGDFAFDSSNLRAAVRLNSAPSSRSAYVGARCARTP